MRNVQKVLGILALSAMVSACSNPFGDSDPLAKESDAVKNGQSPFKPQEPEPEITPEDVLKIDYTPGGYVFREGVEEEITITGRSMFPDSIYQMEAVNIAEFKNAVVTTVIGDKTLGTQPSLTFKWKPPVGFVFNDKLTVQLEISMFTTNHKVKYSTTTNIPIFIYNEAFAVPKIVSVTGLPQFVKESGAAAKFRVNIEDYESKDVNGERPSLLFLSKSTGVSLAPFVKVDKVNAPLDPKLGRWYFDVSVNLAGVEMTNSSSNGYFDVVAISGNSIQSNPYNVALPVWTSVTAPVTTWNEPVVFKIGSNNTFSFTVTDPKTEGEMNVNFTTQCSTLSFTSPPSCSCKAMPVVFGKPKSTFMCTIQWNVSPTEFAGDKIISYKAKNMSPVKSDTDFSEQLFQGTIQLN